MKFKKIKSSIHLTFNTFRYLVPIAAKYKPGYFVLLAFDAILSIVFPFINILFPKFIIDELLGGRNISKLITLVLLTVAGNVGLAWVRRIFSENLEKYADSFTNLFSLELSKKVMTMDFYLTEDSKTLDQIQDAINGMGWYSGGFVGLMDGFKNIISSIITLFGVLFIIIFNAPWLLLITSFILIIESVLNAKQNSVEIKYYKQLSEVNRRFDYVFSELSDFKYGKDIRLYEADEMMLEQADSYNHKITELFRQEAQELHSVTALKNVFQSLSNGTTYGYLGVLTVLRKISIGDFTMLLSASITLSSSINSVVSGIQDIYKKCCYADDYVKFMTTYKLAATKNQVETLESGSCQFIEFKKVSFKYPKTDTYVLKDLDFKLNLNEKLSIVGLNGAGKTTFIKLLCRLYKVEEGEILFDGKNINDIDYNEYIKLFSVVFQDFRLFSFSLLENITLSNKSQVDERLENLIERIGLNDKVEELKKGINTIVYRDFDQNAFNPSGGEEQKIALARAIYRNSPIMILDEPTAALDPKAEYELYNQFNNIVDNKAVIYISHRLSSCKFCDKIAVFGNGKIVEFGSHKELISNKNGKYTELFNLQAEYYTQKER